MEGEARLTPDAVQAIQDHLDGASTIQPVMQVVDVRLVNTSKKNQPAPAADSPQRYRVMLSDGVYTQQSMFATALNVHILDGTLRPGTIVHLLDFMCNTIQDRRIIIVIKLDILQSECAMIGSPKMYVAKSSKEQEPNLQANAAQTNSGNGPYTTGSSISSRTEQVPNNVSYGGPHNGVQGIVGSSVGQTLESNNMLPGGSYSTMSAQNTINANLVQPKSQQSLQNSHQNQRFAVPATSGSFGSPGNSSGRHAQPLNQEPPPVYMNRGPAAKNDSAPRILPISALNPYLSNKWTIKARVTVKTDVRHFNKANGPGKVFNFDLLDSHGEEIRATCFGAEVDRFFDQIEVGKVYLISGGNVKPARKAFNHLNHDSELYLEASTSIKICSGDDISIPRLQYNFRQINEIESMENKSLVDLIGVVTSVSPSVTLMRKRDGTEAQKRTLQLKDTSGRSVEITLWGNFCDAEGQQLQQQCDSGSNPILALKCGIINEFNGKSVGTISTSQLEINPDFPEAERLRQWYTTEGRTADCISLSREMSNTGRAEVRKTIAQIKDENLGQSDKPDWITVKAAIIHMYTGNNNDSTFCYPACTLTHNGKQCNKKVTNNGDGTWRCDRCDESSPACEYRYMLSCQIQDHTGTIRATAFQECGEQIIGHKAEELVIIRTVDQDDTKFAEIIQACQWHLYLIKLRIKEETFNDEQRLNCNIVNVQRLDPLEESRRVLREIDNLLLDGSGSAPGASGVISLNAGFTNTGVGPSVPISNNAHAMNMGGANQFGQQASISGRMSTPLPATRNVQTCSVCGSSGHSAHECPAVLDIQQPPPSAGVGFMSSSYGTSAGKTSTDVCFKCNQSGHWARDCPGQATAPQQQTHAHTAGIGMQQPPAGRSFAANSYGNSAGNGTSDLCYKCLQPGHWARDCPAQTYVNGGASGGYNKQSFGGGY